jgi:alpha-beta hydrolase superfamily lysophospholipase
MTSNASGMVHTSDDGLELWVHHWIPTGETRAVLQVAHGMAEHGLRYAKLAARCNSQGIACYVHDHRGHGKSVPSGEEPGHMADDNAFNRAVDDLHHINRRIAKSHPGIPLVLMGHSMGSFMVQQMLYQHPDDFVAAILSASNGKPPPIATLGRGVARAERLRQGKKGRSPVIDAMAFGDFNRKFRPNRTDFDWLSRDTSEVDRYIADPLCGFRCSNQTWVDLLDALSVQSDAERLAKIPKDKPVYAFSGDRDAVGDMGAGLLRLVDQYRAAWLKNVEYKLYEGGRHEMLNETNEAEVLDDLMGWLSRQIAAPKE